MGAGSPVPSAEGDLTGPQRIQLPLGGVANATAYRDQPGRFLPPETTRNIRPYDVLADRARLGTCPGIVKLLNQQFGGGAAIQAIETVSRASVIAGYHLGDHSLILGRESDADPIAGAAFGFLRASTPALEWSHLFDFSGEGGPASVAAVSIARHPDTDLQVVASAGYDYGGTYDAARVVGMDRFGTQVWSTRITNTTKDMLPVAVAVSRLYTFLAANENVYCLRNDTGALALTVNCNGWSHENVALAVWRDPSTGTEYLLVCFNGKETARTLPGGGLVTAGFYARCFGAGVMKYLVAGTDYTQSPILTQVQWGRQLNTSSSFFEAVHGYFRVSENSRLAPRGAVLTSMAVDPSGNVVLGRCNAGGGPTNAYPPDLNLVAPITVCLVSAAGTMVWEQDTNSLVRVGAEGVLNDVSTGAGVEPSIQAVASDGVTVVAAGAPNTATWCAFGLSAGDGVWRWAVTLQPSVGPPNQSIRRGACAFDPSDGNIILGGDRSTSWGVLVNASLWKLNPVDGSVVWAYDIGAATYGLATFADGRFATATGVV